VLFRILISQGEIIELISDENLEISAPYFLINELLKNIFEIKSKISDDDFNLLFVSLIMKIFWCRQEEYVSKFHEAKSLLKNHVKDIDFVALALLKSCKIWTYEKRLFELGLAISTKELSNSLR